LNEVFLVSVLQQTDYGEDRVLQSPPSLAAADLESNTALS